MKKTLATILCLSFALLCGGAGYYRELLMLPRATTGGEAPAYQTDPYAANWLAIYRFFPDDGPWLNDTGPNGMHFTTVANQATNKISGTNQFGRVSYVATFDGNNDRISRIPSVSDNILLSNDTYSISFWSKRVGYVNSEAVVSMIQTNLLTDGNHLVFSIRAGGSSLYRTQFVGQVYFNGASLASRPSAISTWIAGEWRHFGMTYVGGVVTYFINGSSNVAYTGETGYSLTNYFAKLALSNWVNSVSLGADINNRNDYAGDLARFAWYATNLPPSAFEWQYLYTHPTNDVEQ
jgi:hypothetical protein